MISDPALELAQLCDALSQPSPDRGDTYLAKRFGVEKWSGEFFAIVAAITDRISQVDAILVSEGVSGRPLETARQTFDSIRRAFARDAIVHAWKDTGAHCMTIPCHTLPGMSPIIARAHSYDIPTDVEQAEIVEQCKQLLDWLQTAQFNDRDFVRQCLIDGMKQFLFRVERIQWFGWGYSATSLKEVLAGYLLLERGLDPISNPQAGAALKMIGDFLKKVAVRTESAKGTVETGQWLFDVVKVTWGVAAPAGAFIAGLLTDGT